MLESLVKQLHERGIYVVWRANIEGASGWWVAEASMLILSASHDVAEQVESCQDVLLLTERVAAA